MNFPDVLLQIFLRVEVHLTILASEDLRCPLVLPHVLLQLLARDEG